MLIQHSTWEPYAFELPEDVYIHPTVAIDGETQIGPGTKIWHFRNVGH